MFVTFEGPEGGGKTSTIAAIAEVLRARGQTVIATREPGSGEFGARVRDLLLHGQALPPRAELFLFLADRAHHVATVIRPACEAGHWVLCDRFTDSTLVYQGYARGLDEAFLRAANAFATDGLSPDRTLLFDLPPAVGLGRLTNMDRLDAEPLAFHDRVRAGFLRLAAGQSDRIRVIDAERPQAEVLASALSALDLAEAEA